MAPTARAVGVAIAEYQKAVKRETAALQAVASGMGGMGKE